MADGGPWHPGWEADMYRARHRREPPPFVWAERDTDANPRPIFDDDPNAIEESQS